MWKMYIPNWINLLLFALVKYSAIKFAIQTFGMVTIVCSALKNYIRNIYKSSNYRNF
jgi:hypothetical protein